MVQKLSSWAAILAVCVAWSGCRHGDGQDSYDAPADVMPVLVAQIDDLANCFATHGTAVVRPGRCAVEIVPAEGVQEFPWFTYSGMRVYGVTLGTKILIPRPVSQVVLRHEVGHVFQNASGIPGTHPPSMAVCLPFWYDVPMRSLLDGESYTPAPGVHIDPVRSSWTDEALDTTDMQEDE